MLVKRNKKSTKSVEDESSQHKNWSKNKRKKNKRKMKSALRIVELHERAE